MVVLLATLLSMASGISMQHKADGSSYPWSGKNGDLLRTGASFFPVTTDITNGPTWSYHEEYAEWAVQAFNKGGHQVSRINALGRATPLIDDKENIYYTTVTTGHVYKFSRNGKLLWRFEAGGGDQNAIPEIPVIRDGRLYLTTNGAETIALDMENGMPIWRKKIGMQSAGDTWAMTATDKVVIGAVSTSGGNNNRLVAVLAEDGEHLWDYDTPGEIYNILVAVHNDSCVFSTSDGKVVRLHLGTGKEIWRTPDQPRPSFSTGGTMIGTNGIVYTTSNEKSPNAGENGMDWGYGMVTATNFENGQQIWKANVSLAANNAASVGRLQDGKMGVVVCLGENPDNPNPAYGIWDGHGPVNKEQQIVMLDANTGATLWKFQLPHWQGSALGDMNRPDICLPDAFGNAVIGGDGTVYVGHSSGLMYSLKDADNDGQISPSEVATWQTGAASQGTPAIAPGMLAMTPCDGLHVWLS